MALAHLRRTTSRHALTAALLLAAWGCSREGNGSGGAAAADRAAANAAPLNVFAAGSLARPLRAALDSFSVRSGIPYTLESAGSLELARRLTDLGKHADVVALADEEVFARMLMPTQVTWYARFARNRLVLAHSANAAGLADAERGDWRAVVQRPTIEVGRADPDLDPAGYRTLMLFQLAERHYREAGLAQRLEASAPRRHVRPKSAELVALLQANELDYAWMYESSARGARLPFITLPPEVDLGDEAAAATYEQAAVRVLGSTAGDTLEVRGMPIRYGLTIPREAPQPERAAAFVRFLLSPDGVRVMRQEHLDALDAPIVVGEGRPVFLDSISVAPTPSIVAPAAAPR